MLVGFVGSPCSGKTTTAAKLFAELKDCGQPVEYIAEKARSYIAEKRFALRRLNELNGTDEQLVLSDQDQVNIAQSQFRAEVVMNEKDLIVITDSCVLNSFLYMTPAQRVACLHMMDAAKVRYDLIFICAPVPRPTNIDPNRVHDEAASMAIHGQIETLLRPMIPGQSVVTLTGNTHTRMQQAFSHVLGKFAEK